LSGRDLSVSISQIDPGILLSTLQLHNNYMKREVGVLGGHGKP
jgi:hypothetical protein